MRNRSNENEFDLHENELVGGTHFHHHHILYLNTIRFKAQSLWGRVEIVTI